MRHHRDPLLASMCQGETEINRFRAKSIRYVGQIVLAMLTFLKRFFPLAYFPIYKAPN